jgi:murein DD-endopeptidase MepM/ murein hydrolase activator NlpD
MELRQVDTMTGPAFPTLGAAATGSIAAIPVVDAPKRNRTRPVAGEPVATPVPIVAEPMATAEPVADPHEPTPTAEPVVAAHDASVTAEPVMDEHEPSVTAEPAFVAEPVVDQPVAEPVAESETTPGAGDEPQMDEFEAAARLFSFTGETPIQRPAESPSAESVAAEPEHKPAHKAPRRKTKHTAGARRAATASFSIGVMGIVGLLAVGMTTPAEAVAAATGTASANSMAPAGDVAINVSGTDSQDIQAYMAPTQAQTAALDRSIDYSSVTAVQAGADSGIKNVSNAYFTNDPNSPIQWPFAVGCTISWGFGPRPGEFHEGVDFTPGAGAHVQAIADGVVRVSTDSGGGYGVMIIIDHVIDGKLVSSRYGHMQYGSRQVQVGDHVHVGEYIGRTGNTGRSYGAHTHLEILLNGTTPIDPIPWLRAHVK